MVTLPRIRVVEPYGIRRFLYPLATHVRLPSGTDPSTIALRRSDGTGIPVQIAPDADAFRVDFALSLAPLESVDLELVTGAPAPIPDPLHIVRGNGLTNQQERVRMEFGTDALLRSLVYDGVEHLRAPLRIACDGSMMAPLASDKPAHAAGETINARIGAVGKYSDDNEAWIHSDITACKSWVTVEHYWLQKARPYEIAFTLPFAATGQDLLCDFGFGHGIYTRLARRDGAAVRLNIDRNRNWALSNAGRVDYQGHVAVPEALRPQLWFHAVDDTKAIAVALTDLPDHGIDLAVEIDSSGDITVRGTGIPNTTTLVRYGVCYHFLNAVPAIAAATCPQSILLPPLVEVIA